MLYRALHAGDTSSCYVIQDLALPYNAAAEFVDYTARNFAIWPLWLCPLRYTLEPTFHPNTSDEKGEPADSSAPAAAAASGDQVVNIGLWGWGPSDHDAFVAANRALEDKLALLGGRKWLYAQTYYSEDEFWGVYASFHDQYMALREKYHATTLPTIYDKVRFDPPEQKPRGPLAWLKGRRPVQGVYGMWKGFLSRDYRLQRNAEWKYKGDTSVDGVEKAK